MSGGFTGRREHHGFQRQSSQVAHVDRYPDTYERCAKMKKSMQDSGLTQWIIEELERMRSSTNAPSSEPTKAFRFGGEPVGRSGAIPITDEVLEGLHDRLVELKRIKADLLVELERLEGR